MKNEIVIKVYQGAIQELKNELLYVTNMIDENFHKNNDQLNKDLFFKKALYQNDIAALNKSLDILRCQR